MEDKKITAVFIASIAPIMTGIKITGTGDGMRIQLDIPESEMGQAAKLLLMREKILKVTVELAETPVSVNSGRVY